MIIPFPIRKKNRLAHFDYSQMGAYFVTICTFDRAERFGHIASVESAPTTIRLSKLGKIVQAELNTLANCYSPIELDASVIMPNHVHLMLSITGANAPTISRVIRLWKRAVSKKAGYSVWQKSFHDHVVRDPKDYLRLLEYIENNPAKWALDSLNPKNLGGAGD